MSRFSGRCCFWVWYFFCVVSDINYGVDGVEMFQYVFVFYFVDGLQRYFVDGFCVVVKLIGNVDNGG